ncbi:MAG TPA: Crp/Fnr family transcriptional regulator [Syntrophobacteria bacterium]|nr:Crp/Fnr family transcriptional regulator [Syntrophobacteria bacterium]
MGQIPLFDGLKAQHLEELTDIVADQTLGRGQTVFSAGDEASGFYVVVSGKVKVFMLSPDGKEQILHIFGAGEAFGEVPMFAGGQFPASAEALEKSRIFFFPRKDFLCLLHRDPSLAVNMLSTLSRMLRQLTRLIENLSLKEVPSRLAAYLVYLSDRNKTPGEVDLDIAKSQLASLLGTIPETLSRILNKMSTQGLIDVQGRKILLLDREALEDLAEGGKPFF